MFLPMNNSDGGDPIKLYVLDMNKENYLYFRPGSLQKMVMEVVSQGSFANNAGTTFKVHVKDPEDTTWTQITGLTYNATTKNFYNGLTITYEYENKDLKYQLTNANLKNESMNLYLYQ